MILSILFQLVALQLTLQLVSRTNCYRRVHFLRSLLRVRQRGRVNLTCIHAVGVYERTATSGDPWSFTRSRSLSCQDETWASMIEGDPRTGHSVLNSGLADTQTT